MGPGGGNSRTVWRPQFADQRFGPDRLLGGRYAGCDRARPRATRQLGDPEGAQWQDPRTEVATDEGPKRATKFYVNGPEAVVTVETARGHRVQGTPPHRIKVVDPAYGRVGLAPIRRDRLGRPGADGHELTRGPTAPCPLSPFSEAYWTGEHHAAVPQPMTADWPSWWATSWATDRCTAEASDSA